MLVPFFWKEWIVKQSALKILSACVAVLAAFASYADITWSGAVSVPAGADVTCNDLSAITSLSIGEGATVRFNTEEPHKFPITGSGTIVKESTSAWTMETGISGFNGDYEIAAGVVSIGIANAFGSDNASYKVTVKRGATLESTSKGGKVLYRQIHLAGTGAPGRKGAIELPPISNTDPYLNVFVLDDDATMFIATEGLFFLKTSLDLGNHRLSLVGGGSATLIDCYVSPTGEIYLEKTADGTPKLWLRSSVHSNPTYQISPSDDAPIVLAGGTINLYCGVRPVMRPLYLSGTNTISHSSNLRAKDYYCTNHANWAGVVMFTNLTGHSRLNVRNDMDNGNWPSACMLCVSGPISGNGMVYTFCSSSNRVALLNPANSYSLGTYIEHGSYSPAFTVLGYPGSIPNEDFSSVTAKYGFVELALADDYSRWTFDSAVRFLTGATFMDSCRPRFSSDFTTNGVGRLKMQLSREFPASGYLGARGDVIFEGAGNAEPIGFGWREGRAHLSGPEPMLLGDVRLYTSDDSTATNSAVYIDNGADVTLNITNTLFIGQWDSKQARLVVSNAVIKNSDVLKNDFYTGYANKDWGGPTRGGAIFAGQYSPGILEVLDGAVITNRIIVSGYLSSGPGAGGKQGAVYQRGGHVVALGATKTHHTSCIGLSQADSACGYYELSGGTLETRGQFVIGGYNYGLFVQYGGNVIATNNLNAAPGTKQNSLLMATCNQGSGALYIKKGSWDIFTENMYFGQGTTTATRPTADVTLDGDEAIFDAHGSGIYVGDYSSYGIYSFNLNGGVMRCGGIRLYHDVTTLNHIDNLLCVNFNGGTFRTGRNSSNLFGYNSTTRNQWSTNVVVYAGGATIDTDGKTGNSIGSSVQGAWGKGVKSITMENPPRGLDYVGGLHVLIYGDGVGATAFAHFDSTNMVVDRIVVTSAGYGYTTATATVYSGRTALNVNCVVELEDNENTGSFTKKGAGDLTLNATNTWGGATVVNGGTLKAGCDWAIPTNSAVSIGGGATLDLNGKVAKISSIEYTAGGGSIVNGSAAELPAVPSLRLSTTDITSGRAIEFSGDRDFSGSTLTIEGDDYSGLDENVRRYRVLSVSGALAAAPALNVESDPPSPWCFKTRSDGIVLLRPKGGMVILR